MSDDVNRQKSFIRLLAAILLGVSSDTIADYIASKIDFGDPQYEWAFQGALVSVFVLLALWYGVVKNPYVREIVRALSELQNSMKSVKGLSAQYEGLSLPITINGQERYPQWELPSVMCALANGAKREIRAIYVMTPETFRYERGHLTQEGEYFEACRQSAFRAAAGGCKTHEVVKRIFLVSEQVASNEDMLGRARKLIDRHSENGLFGIKIICPAPTRPVSDFAIYDGNVVLKLEIELFERRISSGLVLWHRNGINTYTRTWDTLWKSPEAQSPEEFSARRFK